MPFFKDKPTGINRLELFLGLVACLGCLSVRCSVAEGDAGPWYQDLCSYKWEAIDQDNKVKYTLKLCESSPSTSCGPATAVCALDLLSKVEQPVGDLSLQRLSGSGTPEFVAVSQCVHYFEWKTYAACKKDKFKPHKEVPCYVFDSDGKKHDLNPLIKVSDGYLVK
ncbi:unnamed protein product [Menidia menidia]|uniref:(Atlantic silverside) hypothetical protein n=1 Tax=Menidia menidia TaxID=238744 RepID=A0A8S4BML8_9TELE|nr:unnamed protein product [Menidia menidia]CAG5959856.1 unnamed protein product [Menidia menidia]